MKIEQLREWHEQQAKKFAAKIRGGQGCRPTLRRWREMHAFHLGAMEAARLAGAQAMGNVKWDERDEIIADLPKTNWDSLWRTRSEGVECKVCRVPSGFKDEPVDDILIWAPSGLLSCSIRHVHGDCAPFCS